MTSSVLAGEKRWASARRSGMTVLGKVAVPKPLNLPSQRLENHGLDPNVEIVPKGTLSWGSRSSSTTSGAWCSSVLSPSADGDTNSPTHFSGRPASGGSGSRPSTASSDKMHEPTANAWGPNSRPSSASGSLASSQTSLTSLRPRSAETKPCSLQLSRFAESLTDNVPAWSPSGTAQKVGIASSSRGNEFSLSSGDFPTLGSEKDNPRKDFDSEVVQRMTEHALRPCSSSGRVVPSKERAFTSETGDTHGKGDTWKRDSLQNIKDGVQRKVENWQGDSQQYLNPNVSPQPFEVWRGRPVNAPPGVWYRGPSGCTPYGAPVGPGGFPMEPFPYYHPQIPPNLAYSQPVPPSGGGPRGHHMKKGDLYRPHMSEAFIRPGLPIQPGFYPARISYEGYYGPPIGYCNSGERDLSLMGMASGASVYNQFPTCTGPNPSNVRTGSGGHNSVAKVSVTEKVKSDESQGRYKVLQKQQRVWDGEEEEILKHIEASDVLCVGEIDETENMLKKNEFVADDRGDEMCQRGKAFIPGDHDLRHHEMSPRRTRTDFFQTSENQEGNVLDMAKAETNDRIAISKVVDESCLKQLESITSFLEGPEVSTSHKDSTLIQKIHGLNAKSRATDGHINVSFASNRNEQKKQVQATHKINNSRNGATTTSPSIIHDVSPVLGFTSESNVFMEENRYQPTASSGVVNPRRIHRVVRSRVDHHGKGTLNMESEDGGRKRSVTVGSSTENPALKFGPSTNFNAQDHGSSIEIGTKYVVDLPVKVEGEFITPNLDPSPVQCTKTRELAKQRSLQIQKEEEERKREQKAKAFAKLEELNRSSQSGDASMQKVETGLAGGGILHGHKESFVHAGPAGFGRNSELLIIGLVPDNNVVASSNAMHSCEVSESTGVIKEPLQVMREREDSQHEALDPHIESQPSHESCNLDSRTENKIASQIFDKKFPKYKRLGYKQKQNVLPESSFGGKLAPINIKEAPRNNRSAPVTADATVVSCEMVSGVSSSSSDAGVITESVVPQHQRRKNRRNCKNKFGVDDALLSNSFPSTVLEEASSIDHATESAQQGGSLLEVALPSLSQIVVDAKDGFDCLEHNSSLPTDQDIARETHPGKSQRSQRMRRNSQGNRFADKFHNGDTVVWAPVRSQNKTEIMNEVVEKVDADTAGVDLWSDNVAQGSLRSKRAEIKRYVPKPAKEMAQQGCIQLSVLSSLVHAMPDETVEKAQQNIQDAENLMPDIAPGGSVVSTRETWNGCNKQSKQAKTHGAWRQRGCTESLFTSEIKNSGKTSADQQHFMKPDSNLAKDKMKCSNRRGSTSDGWNTDNVDEVAPVASVVKVHEVIGRGKGDQSIGRSQNDYENVDSMEIEKSAIRFGNIEMSQTETTVDSKDNRWTGEGILSRWKPKSQANNQRETRSTLAQDITSQDSRVPKKNTLQNNSDILSGYDVEGDKFVAESLSNQSVFKHKSTEKAPGLSHEEAMKNRKAAASKRRPFSPNQAAIVSENPAPSERKATTSRHRPYSPNQGSVNIDETDLNESANSQQGHVSSEFQKNGNRNSRSGRGHDYRRDWSSSKQDNRQHGTPANREKHSQNLHYEYQPVGPYNGIKSNFEEGSQSHNVQSRYRERAHSQTRRGGPGNFHGRQSGTVQIDSG